MEQLLQPQSLSDDQLLRRLGEITRDSRRIEADLVAHIGEVDERRLYAREACSSMFAYCVEVLHLSEPETCLRITAARASRRHPALLEMLRDGRLHLSGIALLAPHLTEKNRDEVLRSAIHRSKRRIEELVAALAPRPDVPALIRRLPNHAELHRPERVPRPDEVDAARAVTTAGLRASDGEAVAVDRASRGSTAPGVHRATVEPLAPLRYKVQFTASAELRDKLGRLQALLRSSIPDGDLAQVIDVAVTQALERLEASRFGAAKNPRKTVAESDTAASSSRRIPAAVKRAVRDRDAGRCRYVDAQGRRCTARERLEFHHCHPHGYGGDRSPENIRLMCKLHNAYLAGVDYGPGVRREARSNEKHGGLAEGKHETAAEAS